MRVEMASNCERTTGKYECGERSARSKIMRACEARQSRAAAALRERPRNDGTVVPHGSQPFRRYCGPYAFLPARAGIVIRE